MAKIELRPCHNQWEDDADYIEIPVNETTVLIIRKEYDTLVIKDLKLYI